MARRGMLTIASSIYDPPEFVAPLGLFAGFILVGTYPRCSTSQQIKEHSEVEQRGYLPTKINPANKPKGATNSDGS